ncbi:MAG TPA: 50S ribosomal protein L17 [Saprospirales bacterium]|nr:50S ribosomal protein L17 [Saprospirales bacterium]HAY70923.1 50S ribosomal protein L17 [Saprospirales bacterium]
MRHGKKFNHLGRKKGHRDALLKNLSIALVTHKRIITTLAKAKALKVYFEPLVTKSKLNTTHSRRIIFAYLQSKECVNELFDVIAPKVGDRPGGYTRVIKMGYRKGDGAEMAMIELVDFNELLLNAKSDKTVKTTRRRRGGKGTSVKEGVATAATATTVAEPVAEPKKSETTQEEE